MPRRIRFDGMKFGWLKDGRWPWRIWEAFWMRRSFTELGPMTTIGAGPFVIWIYWHYEVRP